jgi:hypothetical protein
MIRKHSTRLSQLHDDEPEDEQEQQHRTAAHWYPELGSILDDRPDPGSQITVIGSKTAAAYGTEEDPRNGEYNGGEGDTGMDWAEPAEQDWTEEHLGPQQEAPPPPWAMSPVMARLAEMEEAAGLVGMRHHATAISVTGSNSEYLALKRHLVEDHGKEIFGRANHRDPAWQFTMAHQHDHLHGTGDADHDHEGELDPLWEHGDDASGQYLASRRHATDINGTHVDDAGDAPQHGTIPRAGDPDSYDDRSTEGDGDPRWNQALPKSQHGDKKNENAATVGMYPEGMSAGGGPGLEIGAFTAALDNLPRHMEEKHGFPPQTPGMSDAQRRMLSEDHDAQHAYGDVGHGHPDEYDFDPHWDLGDDASTSHQFTGARVPWTGPQREHLHSWQTVPPGITEGDFVPSGEFLGRDTPPKSQVEERMKEAQGEGLGPVEASADSQWEDHMRDGHGWGETQFNRIRAHGDRIQDLHQGLHDAGMANHSHTEPEDEQGPDREESLSNMFGPSIFSTPRMRTPEGYPIVAPEHGGSSKDPARAMDRLRRVKPAPDPAVYQQTDPARFRRMMSALNVHVHVHDHDHDSEDDSPAPAHEHDDPDNDLDGDEDEAGPGNDSPQAIGDGEEDNPADIPPAGIPGNLDDMPPADPDEWPAAGAEVSERNRAWTQGRDDGKVKRGTPPAAPFAPDDGDSGGGGDQDDDNDGGQSAGTDPNDTGKGDEDTPFSKNAALAMFTAAAGNRDFRFEFTAAWSDVVAKAKRIRAEGYVRITHASAGMVIGEVRGDHDTYESGIQRPVGKRQTISHWACGCPWASFHQKTASSRYAGRPCSHVMALQFEAQSRGMFGRSFDSDAEPAAWSPSSVVVKSYPPYEGDPHRGRWNEEWRAPLARRSSMVHRATPDEARDRDWTPEERDDWERAGGAPGQECLYRHEGPCPVVHGGRTAGSVKYPRPDGYWSEVKENSRFDPHWSNHYSSQSTHVLTGYLGAERAGEIHFSKSDDGRAYEVHMLHSDKPRSGVASAMMDDLYGHVKQAGGWLNHGQRTRDGNTWWSTYREPHPEANVHRVPPEAGWGKYFSPQEASDDARVNAKHSRARGLEGGHHPDQEWHDRARQWAGHGTDHMWRHALGAEDPAGTGAPAQLATTALVRAGEDPDEIGALRLLAGMCSVADLARSTDLMARHLQVAHGLPEDSVARRTGSLESADAFHQALHDNGAAVRLPHRHEEPGDPVPLRAVESFAVTADQANSSWGSQNVSEHPTQKPYGATSPPNKDQSPASYGFLAAPDPENWGGIQDGSALQMPLSNTAAQQPVPGDVYWPSTEGWQQEDQDSFGYSDRANTAGPSTAISPRDPNGIRMEESRAELKDHPEAALPETTGEEIEATAAADGTIGGGGAGTGQGQGAPLDTAALGEFGASFQRGAGTPMGDLNRETSPQAQQPSPVTQEPGMGAQDEYLSPEDPSIQTVGNQQWSGGGADSDEVDVPAGLPQGGIEDIVASFQRSAASRSYTGDSAPGQGDGDIAVAARDYLAKTADVLPQAEADDLIREGRGSRARNLDLLRLEGTHYEDADGELERKGLNLDDYDDDVIFA